MTTPSARAGLTIAAVELSVSCCPGALRPQIRSALAQEGEPLRWAITAVQAEPTGRVLQIEATVIRRP
ncbi:MAG: hypothetical protein VKK98_04825 [Cyanobacteriota bacterium]|nr:hypothetical protein [Cyanobacteriota bacterium]